MYETQEEDTAHDEDIDLDEAIAMLEVDIDVPEQIEQLVEKARSWRDAKQHPAIPKPGIVFPWKYSCRTIGGKCQGSHYCAICDCTSTKDVSSSKQLAATFGFLAIAAASLCALLSGDGAVLAASICMVLSAMLVKFLVDARSRSMSAWRKRVSETSTSGLAGLSDEELVRRMLAAQIKAAETLSVGRNGRLTKRLASIDDNIRTLEARIESNMRVIEATKDDSGKRSLERTNGLIAEEIRENRELRQRLDEEVVKLKSTLADGQRRLVEQVSIVNAQIESAKVSAKAAQDLADARAEYAKVVQFIRLTLVKTIQQLGTCEQNRQALAFANATPDEQFRIELGCGMEHSPAMENDTEIIDAQLDEATSAESQS